MKMSAVPSACCVLGHQLGASPTSHATALPFVVFATLEFVLYAGIVVDEELRSGRGLSVSLVFTFFAVVGYFGLRCWGRRKVRLAAGRCACLWERRCARPRRAVARRPTPCADSRRVQGGRHRVPRLRRSYVLLSVQPIAGGEARAAARRRGGRQCRRRCGVTLTR